MYPFMGSPLSFGAARFLNPGMNMGVQGMNRPITAAQLLGGNMGQAAPITPRTFQMPQRPMTAPVQNMNMPQMMPQRAMQGLLSRDFGQGGRGGAQMGGGRGLGGRPGGVGRA